MLGKDYTPREWLFCHYDPQKGGFEKRRFVHNAEWKLYENGEIYHVLKDPLEQNAIAENQLSKEQRELISTFRDVFAKMIIKEETKQPKNKKNKNQDEDEQL
jgi:hypothetical protein